MVISCADPNSCSTRENFSGLSDNREAMVALLAGKHVQRQPGN